LAEIKGVVNIKQGISHIDNAERNRKVILNIIRDLRSTSRLEVSTLSDLSISTTKRLIEQLLSDGLLMETENSRKNSGRGRKAKNLCLNGSYGYSIGINIEPDRIDMSTLNLAGEVLGERTNHIKNPSREELITKVIQLIRDEQQKHIADGSFLGIGVGIAGLVDARKGIVYYCPNLPGWENVEFTGKLLEYFKTEIFVDDSVRMMTLAEKRYGIAKDFSNFLYIYIGTGVGSGIILDNCFYRGRNGISGEFGHMTIRQDGPLCNCGNRGCMEALVSSRAIIQSVRTSLKNNVYSSLSAVPENKMNIEHISAASMAGDKLAAMISHDAAENIGIGATDLMNVFDPGVIIFSGEVVEQLDGILDEVTRLVRLRGIAAISQRTDFYIGKSHLSAGSRGAATAMIEKFVGSNILNI